MATKKYVKLVREEDNYEGSGVDPKYDKTWMKLAATHAIRYEDACETLLRKRVSLHQWRWESFKHRYLLIWGRKDQEQSAVDVTRAAHLRIFMSYYRSASISQIRKWFLETTGCAPHPKRSRTGLLGAIKEEWEHTEDYPDKLPFAPHL